MKAHLRRIVILLLAACVLCMSGCSKPEPISEITDEPSTGALLAGSNPYGHAITKNGIRMYVDQDGVTTADIVSDGYTFLNAEYTVDTSSSVCSCWIGFDGADRPFEDGAVFRVQPVTETADKRVYQEYYEMIDEKILESHLQDPVTFFRVWIEKKDGTEVELFDPPLALLFEKGDRGYSEAVGISSDTDEGLEQAYVSMNVSPVGEGQFLRIQIRHAGNIIALFTE